MQVNGLKTTRRRTATIYSRGRDKATQQEVSIGVEISEGAKETKDPQDFTRAEGRVFLRFFNSGQPKEKQITVMLEPWEAYDAFLKVQQAVRSKEKVALEMAPHKFTRGQETIITTVVFEKWAVNEKKSSYAIKAVRKGQMHNVSMNETNFLYAGELLRFFSTLASYSDVLARAS